jgi:hypothetical protein
MPLIDEDSGSVIGEICHIKARNPNGARYDSTQTDEQRNAFENLILMCPIHHKVIDDDDESYTVERLKEIKLKHETQTSDESTKIREELEKLLEVHIRSIIDKDSCQNEIIEEEKAELNTVDAFILEEEKRRAKKEGEEFRYRWFATTIGCKDVTKAVKEIFNLIVERYSAKAETFLSRGIKLQSNEYSILLETGKFGCHVKIVNFDWFNLPARLPSNLFLEIFLFEKQIIYQDRGDYVSNQLNRICLKPDIDDERQVFWKDFKDETIIFTKQKISNECFELLINQIKKTSNESL